MGLIEGLVGTFFPLVFLDRGGSLVALSIMISLISLGGAFQSIWGYIIDRYQRPKSLANTALLIGSTSLGLMTINGSPTIFGAGKVGHSLTTAAFGNGNAYLRSAYFSTTQRGRIGNMFMGFNLIGVAFGVFVTGLVYDTYGYQYAVLIHGLAAALAILSLVFFKTIPEFNSSLIQDEQLWAALVENKADLNYSLADTLRIASRSEGLVQFIIGILIFQFAVGLSGPFFIVELHRAWQLSTLNIGVITTFNTIMQVIVIFLFVPIVDIINRKRTFTIGTAFAIIPVIAIIIPPPWITAYFDGVVAFWIFIYFLSSIGWGLVNSLLLTLLIDFVHPKIRATVIGIYGSIQALVVFLAGLLAAMILSLGGTTTLVFGCSISGRLLGLFILILAPSPPLLNSDYYEQRRIFLSRLYTTVERGIVWIPIVGKLILKDK